jgi:ketosteroid isomerase-like protein
MDASERVEFLERAYRLFNSRRIDDLLAMMSADVAWPDVARGAVLRGKEAIRRYWEGQFATADPRVTPTRFVEVENDLIAVVDQRVLDRQGKVLVPPTVVFHRYSFTGDLISQMVVFTNAEEAVAGR